MADVSVDELHRDIDTFFLAMFEAIRGHEGLNELNADELKQQKLKGVTDNYKKVMQGIDNLEGMKMSKTQQEARLQEQSKTMSELRDRILQKEQDLKVKLKQIDQQLATELSDEILDMPGAGGK